MVSSFILSLSLRKPFHLCIILHLVPFSKEALPFMYQTSIEGIRNILKECWNIYTIESNNDDINVKDITWFHKIAALKLAKECNEALFKLTAEGPSVMYVKLLEERLERIETKQLMEYTKNPKYISHCADAEANSVF
jgi:hypothetical protein